jgi:chromate transporter
LAEVAAVFLKLGVTAFGGPAAHIALMHDETVVRRKWLSDQHFLDLVGATNLIPGPNSTEMAIHIGFLRAGWLGLIAGGVSFILPAMLIVMGLAWTYVRFGSTPQAEWLLYGVKPVVVAVIARALWTLGRKAVRDPLLAGVGAGVLVLHFLGINEIALLFAAACWS